VTPDPTADWRPIPDDGRRPPVAANLARLALALLVYAAFCAPAALAVALGAAPDRVLRGPLRLGSRLLLRLLGVRLSVEGAAHLAAPGPRLVVSNHGSLLDVFIFGALLTRPTTLVMKRELARLPLLGYVLRRAGTLFLDREHPARAMRRLGRAALALAAGRAVLVFPEGMRRPHGTLGPFYPGAFHVALRARVPVVPVTVCNAAAILPRRLLAFRPGVVRVVVSPPVETAGWSPRMLAEHVAEVRRAVALPLGRYREELGYDGWSGEDVHAGER
jgi:putative phosphoserine phosphatase/1-acylglycerol-3-phosphate O-acyltransferase